MNHNDNDNNHVFLEDEQAYNKLNNNELPETLRTLDEVKRRIERKEKRQLIHGSHKYL